MLAVAAGDRRAFTACTERFRPLVERYVRRQLNDPSQVEEVVQDVFLEIWLIAERYDPRHSVIAWVRTIAQRRAIDRVRKSRATETRDLRIGARTTRSSTTPPRSVPRGPRPRGPPPCRRRAAPEAARGSRAPAPRGALRAGTGTELGVPVGTAKTRARDGVIALRRVMVPEPA